MHKKLGLTVLCIAIIMTAITAPAQTSVEFGIRGGLGMATQSTENTGVVSTFRRSIYDFYDTLVYRDNYATKSITGPQITAFLIVHLSSVFSIQPEVSLVRKGVRVEGIGMYQYRGVGSESHEVKQTISMSYIEIPVLAKLRIPAWGRVRPSIFAGPALALNISGQNRWTAKATWIYDGDTTWARISEGWEINNLKQLDASLVLGTDLWITSGSSEIVLDIRYCWGSREVFEDVGIENTLYYYSDPFPDKFPIAHWWTGEASDAKNRTLSITLGVSFPM